MRAKVKERRDTKILCEREKPNNTVSHSRPLKTTPSTLSQPKPSSPSIHYHTPKPNQKATEDYIIKLILFIIYIYIYICFRILFFISNSKPRNLNSDSKWRSRPTVGAGTSPASTRGSRLRRRNLRRLRSTKLIGNLLRRCCGATPFLLRRFFHNPGSPSP